MEKPKMLAYHNDPALKASMLAEMAAHREADRLVQGYGYWKDGKGCAVGCLIKSGNHAEYETRFGIPQLLARLEDSIFEGLPQAEACLWPERFLAAIKPGADLGLVFYAFMHWLLVDPQDGVIKWATKPATINSIVRTGGLYLRHTAGEIVARAEWQKAAAYAAAAYAAAADDDDDDDDDDADAAYAAAYAAADDAYAYAAAAYAARLQARVKQANKLIELLEAA